MKKQTAVDAAQVNPLLSAPSFYPHLSNLFLSPGNVRKQASGIDQLAVLIDAQGLLQALQVTAELDEGGNPTGRYGVEAGGRRLRALQLLESQGKIANHDPIECKLVEAERACEVSLTENLGQTPMHPSDEFAAYKTLVDAGQTPDAIAKKFGVTVVHVLRRMKMARVAPELVTLFRNGKMTLDQIQAMASTDDQERQVQVWGALPQWKRNSSGIRQMLEEDEVRQDDRRVKVIGLDNYLQMGGSIREDLFSQEQVQFLTDLGLVEIMLGEAMEAKVNEVRAEGWSWVETFEEWGYDERHRFNFPQKKYLPETTEQEASRKALEAELEKVCEEMEALEDCDDDKSEEIDKLSLRSDALENQIEALEDARLDTSEADKSAAGAVVVLGNEGFEVHRGLTLRNTTQSGAGVGSGLGGGAAKKKPDVPESLCLNLSSCKTAAMQASMLSQPHVTLSALANSMAQSIFGHGSFDVPVKITTRECRSELEKNSSIVGESRALELIDMERGQWREAWPKEKSLWFAWFMAQPLDRVLSFIVFATALSTNAITGEEWRMANSAELAQALNLDMAQWWEAGPESYFDLIPKGKIVQIVAGISGGNEALKLAKLKKPEVVAQATAIVAGKGWLPNTLKPIAVPALVSDSDESEVGHGDFEEEKGEGEEFAGREAAEA